MKHQTDSKLGKDYVKVVYCPSGYLTYIQGTWCKMPGRMKHKMKSRLLGEISITSDMQITPPWWQKSRWTKEPLDENERGEWKIWLNSQKTKIMVSGPNISWQVDGETVGTVADFIFLGSKITADIDCSYKIKRLLLLWRKAMTNLGSISKRRDIICQQKSV